MELASLYPAGALVLGHFRHDFVPGFRYGGLNMNILLDQLFNENVEALELNIVQNIVFELIEDKAVW